MAIITLTIDGYETAADSATDALSRYCAHRKNGHQCIIHLNGGVVMYGGVTLPDIKCSEEAHKAFTRLIAAGL